MSLYSYVKKRVLWYQNNSANDIVDITDYVKSISTTRTFSPINNRCDIGMIDCDLLYSNGNFVPQENDKIFVYAKVVTMANDTELDSLDIIWNGKFVDHKRTENSTSIRLTLNVVDWGYDVFNTIHTESYNGAGLRTNEVFKRIVETASELDDGTFKIDTSLVASLRNDGSQFPVIAFSQTSKPSSELMEELSQTLWTNSESEISTNSRVIKYPMIIDFRGNYAIWQEQSLDTTLLIDDYSNVDISIATANEGSSNRLILDCGDDLNGNNITIIIRNENSGGTIKKDAQKSRTNLAGRDESYDNSYHSLRLQASSEGWTNTTFRNKVTELAKSYSVVWFDTIGRGKPTIKIVSPKINIELGEIVNIQRKKFQTGLYRVIRITQDIEEDSWTTTLTVEKFSA